MTHPRIVSRIGLLLSCALMAAPQLHAQNVLGEVFATDASVRGSVVLSGNGTRVLSGSQVGAGDAAALLKLERGGAVRICPKTSLSLNADATGKSLVLGVNEGAIEVDYSLASASDSVLTPDFRLQLISPGNFHFAVAVAASGDTCLRSLAGNDAAIFVAEMMGSESYQLSPGKSVLFKAGRISGAQEAPAVCGCPESKAEPKPAPAAEKPAPMAEMKPPAPKLSTTEEPHMQVDTTFVYRGKDATQDLYVGVSRLSYSNDNSGLALALLPKVNSPGKADAVAPAERKPGLLRRFGSFLGKLFKK